MWISVIVYLITRAMVRRCGKRESFAMPLLYKNTIIHQDRLGTNKGRTQNKRRVFLGSGTQMTWITFRRSSSRQ
jgi:hypothetical protein